MSPLVALIKSVTTKKWEYQTDRQTDTGQMDRYIMYMLLCKVQETK